MMDAWLGQLFSLFMAAMETWGTLYYWDTFLPQRKAERIQKYRPVILYVCMEIGVLSGRLIGWWKIIPILFIYVLLCLLFCQISFWQSFFFSTLSYCLIFAMDYMIFVALDGQMNQSSQVVPGSYWDFAKALLAKTLWIVLLLLMRNVWRQREDYPLTNRQWMQLSIIPVISLTVILAMSLSYTNDERVQIFYQIWAIGIAGINHPVVNAILNQKYRSAKEKNISMSLKLVYEDGNMILSVRNPVREKVEIIDNIVRKEHGSGHGIGLLNVRSAVEQYDGDLALACDEKEFRAVVIL